MDYRVDSRTGATILDTAPITTEDLKLRNEEIEWLKANAKPWGLINGRLTGGRSKWLGRDYLTAMAQANYGVLAANPPPASFAGLTTTATEAGLISTTNQPIYTPIPANQQMPQAWQVRIAGVFTSPASTGTVTIIPRLGNTNTSPSLGSSAALAQTSSLTNATFSMWGDITMRASGLAGGANATATGLFHAELNTAVGGASNGFQWNTGASTIAFDNTLTAPGANGGALWIGMLGATAFPTYTLQQIIWINWN